VEHRVESIKDALLYLVAEGDRVGGLVNVADISVLAALRPQDKIMAAAQIRGAGLVPLVNLVVQRPVPPGRYWMALVMLPMSEKDTIIVTGRMPNGGSGA
jgi:hypothetical protein